MPNKIIVAGGGASGLTAAIFAARQGAKVTVLEHKDKVGKKILMTGNGKCNMTNMSSFEGKYFSSDNACLDKIYETLEKFNAADTREFFKELGLYTKNKRDGGVYPVSEQASSVLCALKSECERLNVRIETDCEVKSIKGGEVKYIRYIREPFTDNNDNKKKPAKKEKVTESRETLKYDKLILAMGSKAAKVSGSDGSGYYFAGQIGHRIIEPLAALVQLRCRGDFFNKISGVRAQAKLELFVDGDLKAAEEGELQITDYGISGIPVFQISRIASRAIYEGKKCMVKINFIPYIKEPEKELLAMDLKCFSHKSMEDMISGFVHRKLSEMICEYKNILPSAKVGDTEPDKILACIKELAGFKVDVTEANSFDNAQVCSGGVPLDEVDNDFRSLKDENIYIVGELLDCDGLCGGYNLQWAWATGAIAGKAAGKDFNDND